MAVPTGNGSPGQGRPRSRLGSRLKGWVRLGVAAVLPCMLTLASSATYATAQDPMDDQGPAAGAVYGIVTDSTTAAPLGGAIVTLVGTELEATTDAEGRFRIESVPPGAYQVTLFHVRLQVLGTSLPLASVEVGTTDTRVELAVPSRSTLLLAWCGDQSRSVGGVVRDVLTETPVSGVNVLVFRAVRRGPPSVVTTDDFGEYRYCDGPTDEGIELQPIWGELAGRRVAVAEGSGPHPQDLFLALTEPVTLTARVLDARSGTPVPGATVDVAGSQVRGVTDDLGRVRLRGIPAGTIAISSEHVAFSTRVDSLFAESGESVEVDVLLFEDAIELDPIVVTARSAPQLEAARAGIRYDGMTRAMVDAVVHRTVSFAALLRAANVPGLRIAERGDGQLCVETLRRGSADCNMVEVFLNGVPLPEAGRMLGTLDPVSVESFQFVPPLEARTRFRGGNVGNGVLLIYTR